MTRLFLRNILKIKNEIMHNKIQFTIPVKPPFRLDLTTWALRRRHKNIIDRWDGKRYSRVFTTEDTVSLVIVEQTNAEELNVIIESSNIKKNTECDIKNLLQKMLGTKVDLKKFYKMSQKDEHLKLLIKTFRGVRPPRFPSIFEALLNSISCQQITLDLGILLLNRLSENYGKKFESNEEIFYAFPEPEDLQNVEAEELRKLGYSFNKAHAIIELSKQIVDKKLILPNLENSTNKEIVKYLVRIRGIGRWSAEYALLRGFGRIDIFPGDDVGAQKNLMQLMQLSKRPDYDQIHKLTEVWNPYAGLVYFHLLLEKLQKKNFI